ncbi:MAG: cytochrome C, partial [candidate division Zixibacteria bacterium]|nr:cytochrome C [candidate division Zixibacteria bacterium]
MFKFLLSFAPILILPGLLMADDCVQCHKETTPGIVTDWELSKHSENDISCG